MSETKLRDDIARLGQSLHARGLTFGASGNISVRLEDGWLMTPTGASLGDLDPARLARLDRDGTHRDGDAPTKESFLHLAMYAERPTSQAIVHLHSTWSVAVSCLRDIDPQEVLPPITAYYVMKVGKLPLIPYFAPGDPALAAAIGERAGTHHAVLLANHGPVVAGDSLLDAVYTIEELEETAKLFLLLRRCEPRFLDAAQVIELQRRFPRS